MGARSRLVLMFLIAALGAARSHVAAVDIGPAGAEFQVNSYTTGPQFRPSVSSDAFGNFVAVWESIDQDGPGVFGQRFASGGARLGSEFQVNTYTRSDQTEPAVASDAAGNFVAVWSSYYQDDGNDGVFGQRFASAGTRLGSEFQVATYTPGFQDHAAVARDAAGNFVVVWGSDGQDGDDAGVFGQRFASGGTPLGGEFMVNTFTPGNQNYPAVATDMLGNFVVAWQSFSQDGQSYGIFGQRFASGGAPLGTEFQINTYFTGTQVAAAIGTDAAGDFVVAWQSANQDASGSGVFAQRFANDGDPLGDEFQVNSYTGNAQGAPAVFRDKNGPFVVAWDSVGQDGLSSGIFGQRFAPSGAKIGSELQINTFTVGAQTGASVTGATGQFVVAWGSNEQDGSQFGVFAQRFALPGGFSAAPALSHGLLVVMGGLLGALGWRGVRRRSKLKRS